MLLTTVAQSFRAVTCVAKVLGSNPELLRNFIKERTLLFPTDLHEIQTTNYMFTTNVQQIAIQFFYHFSSSTI